MNKSSFVCGKPGHPVAHTCSIGKNAPLVSRPHENQQRSMTSGKFFVMMKEDAATFNTVIADNISITLRYSYTLFYPGTTQFFISTEFTKKLDVLLESFEFELCVDTLTSDFLVVVNVFKRCVIQIDNVEMHVNLVS